MCPQKYVFKPTASEVPDGLLTACVVERVIAPLALECERAIQKVFDAATGVEAEPGLGVVARCGVRSEFEEVRSDAGTDEWMPLPSFPVVAGIDGERYLPQ